MSEIVDVIKRVAAFAEAKDTMHQAMCDVHFRKGEVFAQSLAGGAIEPVKLNLNCGVNARRLLTALRAAGKDPGFKVTGNELLITSGRTKIRLFLSPINDAPRFHRPKKGIKWVPVPHLHDAHKLSWAASKDTTRTHLCGVVLTACGIGATNGHVAIKLGSEDYCKLLKQKDAMIVPPGVLKGLPTPTWACVDGGRLFLAATDKPKAFRSANLVNAVFPSIDDVMKDARKLPRMVLARTELSDMLKRARLSTQSGHLEITKGRLAVKTPEGGNSDPLFLFADSVSYEQGSDDLVPPGLIGLNLEFIQACADTANSDAVQVGMKPAKEGGLDPVFVIDGILEAVVAPMRI